MQLVTSRQDVGHEGLNSPLGHHVPFAQGKIEIEELEHLLQELHHVGELFGLCCRWLLLFRAVTLASKVGVVGTVVFWGAEGLVFIIGWLLRLDIVEFGGLCSSLHPLLALGGNLLLEEADALLMVFLLALTGDQQEVPQLAHFWIPVSDGDAAVVDQQSQWSTLFHDRDGGWGVVLLVQDFLSEDAWNLELVLHEGLREELLLEPVLVRMVSDARTRPPLRSEAGLIVRSIMFFHFSVDDSLILVNQSFLVIRMLHKLDSVCRYFLAIVFHEVGLRGFSDVLLDDHVLIPPPEEASGVLGLRSGILPFKLLLLLHTILFVSDSSSHRPSIPVVMIVLGGLVFFMILGLDGVIQNDLRTTFLMITRILLDILSSIFLHIALFEVR